MAEIGIAFIADGWNDDQFQTDQSQSPPPHPRVIEGRGKIKKDKKNAVFVMLSGFVKIIKYDLDLRRVLKQ